MNRLTEKWALITGASRGVGQQIALGLAREGCNLILHGRTLDAMTKTLRLIESYKVQKHVVAAELSKESEVQAMLDRALEISERIDIVYNNAAIMTPFTENFTTACEDYRKSFEVNVIALIKINDRLIPKMIERGYGRVINTTSGIQDIPELLPYAISKAAVDKYVKDLIPAVQGTGVLVNLLDPGWVQTDLGGVNAPDSVDTVLPGVLVPALLDDDGPQAQLFRAQDYKGKTI
jgi:short-subunit dehydrogenase